MNNPVALSAQITDCKYARERGNKMLFMCIYNFEPKEREAVVKRFIEKGSMIPPGVKLISEWSVLAGGRMFRLIESDDTMAIAETSAAWVDLCKLEVIPVIETKERMKFLSKKQTSGQ